MTPAETEREQNDVIELESPTSPVKRGFMLPEDDSPSRVTDGSPSKATNAETPTAFSSKGLQPMELDADHTQLKAALLWLHLYAFTMGVGVF